MYELYVLELKLKWYVKNVRKSWKEIQVYYLLVPVKVAFFEGIRALSRLKNDNF